MSGCLSRTTHQSPLVLLRLLPQRLLHLADALLHLTLDLLAGVATSGADHVIDLALDLLGFSGGYIFASHRNLLYGVRRPSHHNRCTNRQPPSTFSRPSPRAASRCRNLATAAHILLGRGRSTTMIF